MHFGRVQRELWLVASLALVMGLTNVDAQLEQLIGPAMQHIAQMGQMMQGGMMGAVQSLGGPEGLMKIGMAVAQGFMQGAAGGGGGGGGGGGDDGSGRSGLFEDAEFGSRSGLEAGDTDGPYSLLASSPMMHEHHGAPHYTGRDAGHRESLDYWRSALNRWSELSSRAGIIDDRQFGGRGPGNRFNRQPSWSLGTRSDFARREEEDLPSGRSGLSDQDSEQRSSKPDDFDLVPRQRRLGRRRLRVSDDDQVDSEESNRPRLTNLRRNGSWQRRFRRLATDRSSSDAEERGQPRFVSSKYMLGSPYDIKDQAAFPTSTSMKRGKGGRGTTLLVSQND